MGTSVRWSAIRAGWLLTCLLSVLLAGCGQKGDLYLPEPTPAASAEDEEEDDA